MTFSSRPTLKSGPTPNMSLFSSSPFDSSSSMMSAPPTSSPAMN